MNEQNVSPQKKGKSVLIIDDDAMIIKMYTIAFNEQGVEVLMAYDGKEGIAVAQKQKPDLILLDVLMLGNSGLTVLKMLKRDPKTKHIPVIIFSNIQPDEDVINAFAKAGAAEYLVKSKYTPQETVNFCREKFLQRGFTLIEPLIYVAIVGSVVTAMVLFSLAIADAHSKNYAASEVNANGRVALQIIAARIRESTDATVTNPEVLTLAISNPSKNPTVFSLGGGGILQMQEGTGAPLPLISEGVKVTNLLFTDVTGAFGNQNRKNVQINITLEYGTALGGVYHTYTKNFRTAVSERQ